MRYAMPLRLLLLLQGIRDLWLYLWFKICGVVHHVAGDQFDRAEIALVLASGQTAHQMAVDRLVYHISAVLVYDHYTCVHIAQANFTHRLFGF